MKATAPLLALAVSLALASSPAHATIETPEAKLEAATAAHAGLETMAAAFATEQLDPGEFRWKDGRSKVSRVVVSLTDQLLYAYDGEELVAVSTISSGRDSHPTPTGIFPIMEKKRHHRSNRYNDAPMPFMQRLDNHGIALHAGELPGYRASHGCIRLPAKFAAKLFAATDVGTQVLVGRYELPDTARVAQAD